MAYVIQDVNITASPVSVPGANFDSNLFKAYSQFLTLVR